ncbi:MAG: hypothetical protein MdMp014T_0492 [Treponematales bacterium]
MKHGFWLTVHIALAVCALPAQTVLTLDAASRNTADFFYEKIPAGWKVAVFDLAGDNPEGGALIAERLSGIFMNERRLRYVERGEMLKLVHQEQEYSVSGNVDERAEIRIGHELGAQAILSGSLTKTDYGYALVIRAVATESGEGLGQFECGVRVSFADRMKDYYAEHGLFFAGLRAGLGLGMYTPGADALPASYSGGTIETVGMTPGFDFALYAAVAPLSFLALQAEAMLVQDRFTVSYTPPMRDRETVREAAYTSLLTPIVIRLMFKPKIGSLVLLLQGYGGIYFTIPLAPMEASGSAGAFSKPFTAPLGFTGGGSVGVKAGPGFVLLDARYMADSGDTEAESIGKVNKRQRLSFSLGYELRVF